MSCSISVSHFGLSYALNATKGLASKKQSMPILKHVWLKAQGKTLTITSSDLDVFVTTKIPATFSEDIEVCLPSKELLGIVKALPKGGDLEIVIDGDSEYPKCVIKSGDTELKIEALAAQLFPVVPSCEDLSWQEGSARTFAEAMDKVLFSACQDFCRPSIYGVRLDPTANFETTFVATNGHRLTTYRTHFIELLEPVTLYHAGVVEVMKVLDLQKKSKSPLSVAFARGHVFFQRGDCLIAMKRVEEDYPDYEQVIPRDSSDLIQLDRNKLLDLLKRVTALSKAKGQGVTCTFSSGKMTVTCESKAGTTTDSMPANWASTKSEDPSKISFNVGYLTEALKSLTGDKIYMEMTSMLDPALLRSGDDEDRHHICVVMPMRL